MRKLGYSFGVRCSEFSTLGVMGKLRGNGDGLRTFHPRPGLSSERPRLFGVGNAIFLDHLAKIRLAVWSSAIFLTLDGYVHHSPSTLKWFTGYD